MPPFSALRRSFDGALDFLLPRVCILCEALLGAHREMLCVRCANGMLQLPHPRCARCGHPNCESECRWCPFLDARVHAARSVCWVPDGTGGEIVHKLKYGGWTGLAAFMADRIVRLGRVWPPEQQAMLVPVPLGAGRLRERGYNQCAAIASALARRWSIPMVTGVVTRDRETRSQVLLTPEERSVNVQHAFVAGPAADAARGAHVVLVDDVVTTGATLNACAAAVFAARASTVSYITFGRARAAFDRTDTTGA